MGHEVSHQRSPHNTRVLTVPAILSAYRFVDLSKLDEVTRANRLPFESSQSIEYLVHGKYRRTEDDINGIFGAWWVPLEQLVLQLGEPIVEIQLEGYENEAQRARQDALANLAEAREDERGGPAANRSA